METKLNIKSKVIFMLVFAVITTLSCQTPKEIGHQSEQSDTLNDYSGTSGYFVDERDGKRYKWVRIGDQIWMAENLAYQADSGCVAFKHKECKAKKYGYYYSWETAMQSCPTGWHLPSEKEIKNLTKKLGDSDYYAAFDSLKKNNDFGLNLRRTGYYNVKNDEFCVYYKFPYLGEALFWTGYFEKSMVSGMLKPYYFYKQYFWRRADVNNFYYDCYHPVRCVKD